MRALALSGGGFRATLYHLGVLRCLAEEEKLKDVETIYAVSGGSILAAHVVLNWDDYRESKRFGDAAKPLIAFIQHDVRGKVFRRWLSYRFGPFVLPLAIGLAWAWQLPVVFWWLMTAAMLFTFAIIAMAWRDDQHLRKTWFDRLEEKWREYGIYLAPLAVIAAAWPLTWVLWWIAVAVVFVFLLALGIEVLTKRDFRARWFVRQWEPFWRSRGIYVLPIVISSATWPLAGAYWSATIVALALFALALWIERGWDKNSRLRLLVKEYEEGLYGTKDASGRVAESSTLVTALASTAEKRSGRSYFF